MCAELTAARQIDKLLQIPWTEVIEMHSTVGGGKVMENWLSKHDCHTNTLLGSNLGNLGIWVLVLATNFRHFKLYENVTFFY